MRVVFDTCVWIAAIRSRRGASFAFLSEIPHRRFQFGISVPLFHEYKAKLFEAFTNGKIQINHDQIETILSALAFFGTEVPIYHRLRPNLKDENDNKDRYNNYDYFFHFNDLKISLFFLNII